MTFINTILPKDIQAAIDIPNDFIVDMVEHLKDVMIIETDDRYALSPNIKGDLKMVPDDPNTIIISHEYLATILIKKYPLELMIYYQHDASCLLNVELLHVLVKLLHQDPLFIKARNNELLTTSEPMLEDMIDFDTEKAIPIPTNMYNDQASYNTTMDILKSLGQQNQ